MKRLLGYILMGVGFVGFLFFWNYKGTAIALKELWFILSFLAIVAGAYLYAKYKLQQQNNYRNNSNADRTAQIEHLKRSGDRVRVTLGNAEVKSRSYQQEIISGGLPSRIEMLDGLYDRNRNYKTEEIQQTYIVAYKQYNGKAYKFVSQATTQNADDVRRYIDDQKGIDLYVDPMNPTNYYFDLPYL